jgi:hypothetical protein
MLRLTQLDAMDIMEAWKRARDQGLNPPIPDDPSGTPFVFDPATGGIIISPASKLFPLPGQLQAPR